MNYRRGLLILAVSFLPFGVHGVERRDVTIPKTKVAHKRAVVNWQGMHIRIPKKALKKSARVKMRNRGALADLSLPTPNKKFRVRGEVYSYHVSGKLQKPLRVRLDFDFDHYGKRRKKILFLPSGGKKWQALPTTMLRRKNKLHAMLPEKSGRVLVVTHKVKRETPKKRSSHSSYRGTPYSDKAVVMDVESGKWLYSQKGKQQQHIASITKLATVYTFLNQDPDLTDVVRYDDNYDRIGATVEVEDGDKFRLTDALYSTLMPSANNMATLLSHNSGFSHAGFVTQMNILADDLNLGKTRFTEQTGLDDGNVSTPKNTARFALHVFQSYPRFFRAAAQSDAYSFDVRNRDERFVVESTNTFEGRGRYEVKGFKTGYYPGTAERTLAIWIQSTESKGEIMIVLFGNPNYGTINDEAYELADWAFRNWRFHNYD